MLRVQLLGQFDVRVDDKRVLITSRAGQSLMAYLLLTVRITHRREKLAGLLWPDTTDENARKNLRQELWRIRKALTASQLSTTTEYILADELTIAFNPAASYWLDAAQLERDLSSGTSLDERIQQAALYQGELLPGFYDEWMVLERERVQAVYERQMQQLLTQLIAEGRWAPTLEWSERWIALGHTPEPAYRALMIAYAALGDPAKVAATFDRCAGALENELGVEPSAETEALHDQLLRGEAVKLVNLSVARVAPMPSHSHDEPPAPGDPPFKGLQYFDEGDAALFFGRELLTARLIGRLRESDFLAVVVGASGSGKSSAVRAGLIPALKTGAPLADGLLPPTGSTMWRYEVTTPTAHPLEALAIALTRQTESVTAAVTLMDDLMRDARSLRLFIRRSLDADPGARHLLLIVDQFEELFTLCHDEFEREAFIDNLLTAILPSPVEGRGVGGEVTLILTIRADFYAHLAQYPDLREAVAQQQEYIGPLTVEELRRAIEEPARRGGWEFEPGLVDLMLRDVGDEPGALPLLSHALLETWLRRSGRTLTLKGYADTGGVRGAIAFTAETVYQQLSSEQQNMARHIFLRLTELGEGTEDTRRRATIHELISQPGQATMLHAVLNELATARLITLGADSAEVAHEAVIREWPRLHEWLNDDREGLQLHRHVTNAAHEWELLDRDPGALYRGARLAQASEWAATNEQRINELERAFLNASLDQELREEQARETQQQRELDAAQELAETRQRANTQLRRRARYLAGAFIVAIVMASAALFFGNQANQNATAAQQSAQEAQSANRIATSRELAGASNLNLNVDPERSILLALQAEAQADTFQAQDALHQAVQTSRLLKRVAAPAGSECNCIIAYSPDGTRLAAESRDADGQLTTQIRDAATLDVLFSKPGVWADDRWVYADRLPIAAPSADHSSTILTVWDATGASAITTITMPIYFDDPYAPWIDLSPDLTKVAAVSHDDHGDFAVYDMATGQRLPDPRKPGYGYNGMLRFSPDSQSLLAIPGRTDTDQYWALVDVATGRERLTRSIQGQPSEIDFSPDGKRFAVNENQVVRIVDSASGQDVVTLSGHTGSVESGLQFNADGTRIVTVAADGTTRIWDAATGKSLLTVFGDEPRMKSAAFSPDGTRLATLSAEGVKLWAIAPTDAHEWLAAPAAIDCDCMIAFSPDGTQLAAFGGDNTVKVMDSHSGQTRLTLPDPGSQGMGLAFSPDGTRLATSGTDDLAHVWDLVTGKELVVLKGHTAKVNGVGTVDRVIFSPDGTRLATINHNYEARLWDATTGQILFSLHAYDRDLQLGQAVGLAFSPDGSRLATAGGTEVKIWDTHTGQVVLALPSVADLLVYSVAFSPDGKHLAVGFRGGAASVWATTTGHKLFDLPGHTGSVRHLTYSPDGTRIATASVDGTTKLWDATTGAEQLTLTGHTGQVTGLSFSPDGTRLATTSRDGTVRVDALNIEDLIKIAQSRVTRSLTTAECQKYLHMEECPAP
jgi:WD40 repeat protein/DNA-binding SARP family transcriptional activator